MKIPILLTDEEKKILIRVIASSAIATAQIEEETGEFSEEQREKVWGCVVTFWCRLHGDDKSCQEWFEKARAYQVELGPQKIRECWIDAQAAT